MDTQLGHICLLPLSLYDNYSYTNKARTAFVMFALFFKVFVSCFVCLFVFMKPGKSYFASRPGSRIKTLVSVSCAIGRAATSVASARLEMRLGANPEGAAPGEAAASCSSKKAQTGETKACRPTPGIGSPHHGWGLPPAPSHF